MRSINSDAAADSVPVLVKRLPHGEGLDLPGYATDGAAGMDVLSTFTLWPDGKVERNEIFNADKKGLLPLVKEGKQISPNEIVMPSLKKGYLQYLKILF